MFTACCTSKTLPGTRFVQHTTEAAQLILSVADIGNARNAKVYRDSEWQEWRVVFYVNNTKQQGADYHTDDKADAEQTARNWVIGNI